MDNHGSGGNADGGGNKLDLILVNNIQGSRMKKPSRASRNGEVRQHVFLVIF